MLSILRRWGLVLFASVFVIRASAAHADGPDREDFASIRAWVESQPRTFENEVLFAVRDGQIVRSERYTTAGASFGDFDGDGDVDRFDYTAFQICLGFSGPGFTTPLPCLVFDSDADLDIDQIDVAAFQNAFTGSIGGIHVEAGSLFPAIAAPDGYYSGEPGTSGSNALRGIARQAGYTQDDLWYEWSVNDQPVGSGEVLIANRSFPETPYDVLPPFVVGEYVFELTVTNLITAEYGSDLTVLRGVECFTANDCDNGDYCDGAEECSLGVCSPGQAPCDPEEEICQEDSQTCDSGWIISPSTGFGISVLDPPVWVLYSVASAAESVRGYRLPVADGTPNSPPIGDRVIIATNLRTGVEQVFSFDPQESGVGFYRVGIDFTLNGVEGYAESRAVVQVQGSPAPIFILPTEALTQITQGTDVDISFDCRDPEGIVQWRLFYLSETDSRNNPPDQLGTALATGSGNVGMYTLQTDAIALGDYQLGVSATDSGMSIAATVAAGESDRIVTIPNNATTTPVIRVVELSVPMPPTIEVTEPATTVTIPTGGSFTIRFTGTILEPDATETMGTIEIFYDLDDNVGNGFATIAADLPVSTTSVPFPTNVLSGTYFIGATIFDGINSAVTDYATGKIIVSP